jgi:hypothetical protein
VEVTTGIAKARIEIAEPALEGGIIARIIGPDGQLLGGVDLVLWRKDDKSPSPRRVSSDWDRRSDGSYLLRPQEDIAAVLAGTEPGSLELAATHPKFAEARGAVAPGNPAVAEVSFREPGRLEVVVTGTDDGQLVARVRAELRAGSGPRAGSVRLGSASVEGTVISYDRIAPGDYEARVSFSCGGGGELQLHSGPVSIKSGEALRIEVLLPEVHAVEVRAATGGSSRDPFAQFVVRGEGLRCRLRAPSRTERLFLPQGNYEVAAEDRRNRTEGPPLVKFKVPGASAIEIPVEADR